MVVFLPFWWSRTPTFHSLLFSGYVFVFLIHYVSYFPCFLAVAYPAISFFAFFGVLFCLSHTLCFIFFLLFSGCVPRYFIFRLFRGTFPSFSYIMFHIFLAFWWSRTPIFHFLYFSGYAPSRTSLIMASAHSYSPKTYPNILFLTFLGVQPSTTPSTLFHPPRTKAYSGGVSPQSMLSLASLSFPIVFRQPEAHLPHYLPYTFADISDTSGTVSTMPSVPEMPLITSMPIEYIFTTCMYGIM